MKKSIMIVIFFIALSTISYADEAGDMCDYLVNDLNLTAGNYIPSDFGYKSERVNGYSKDEKIIGYLIIDNYVITDMKCGEETENATLKVHVKDKETLITLHDSAKPVDTLDDMIGNGEIKIEGVGFTKSVGVLIDRIKLKIASWFI